MVRTAPSGASCAVHCTDARRAPLPHDQLASTRRRGTLAVRRDAVRSARWSGAPGLAGDRHCRPPSCRAPSAHDHEPAHCKWLWWQLCCHARAPGTLAVTRARAHTASHAARGSSTLCRARTKSLTHSPVATRACGRRSTRWHAHRGVAMGEHEPTRGALMWPDALVAVDRRGFKWLYVVVRQRSRGVADRATVAECLRRLTL